MLSACILPSVLHRHDQLDASATSSVLGQREDGQLETSDESASDGDEKPPRGRRARRFRRHQTSGERAVRRNFLKVSK